MTVTSWIWIDGKRHNFTNMEPEKKKDCATKMQLQLLKAIGRKPTDSWLLENPVYAEYWEEL